MEIELAAIGRALLYLGVPFVLLVFVAQWKWARTCDRNIQVLVALKGGGGKFSLAPKAGGEVSIVNPVTKETRTWPINELATIDVPYPGLGFLPRFLQKSIRLAIVNEGDWEPMLNRSPLQKRVASEDVIEFMDEVAKQSTGDIQKRLTVFLKEVSPSSTREMIADPATLGALRQNTIMKALATISDDLLENVKSLRGQLSRVAGLNPTIIYLGLFAIGALVIFLAFKTMQMDIEGMAEKIDTIYKALESVGVQP